LAARSNVWSHPRVDAPPLFAQTFHAEPIDFSRPSTFQGERFVTESNIVKWAAQRVFSSVTLSGGSAQKEQLVRLLGRGEDGQLHALWRKQANYILMLVARSHVGVVDVLVGGPRGRDACC